MGVGTLLFFCASWKVCSSRSLSTRAVSFSSFQTFSESLRKLRKFFNRFGYEEIESNYTISGVKANLLVKQIKGKTDITPVAQRIIPDFYSRFLTVFTMEKMLDIKPVK
mgnify:CR=1 FL=1